MIVWDRLVTGSPVQIEGTLRRKIGALGRHRGYHQKIGITNDPKRRWRHYVPLGAHDMHVLYRSSSLANVRHLERALVAWLP